MTRASQALLWSGLGVALAATLPSCLRDFGQFDASGAGPGATAGDSSAGSGAEGSGAGSSLTTGGSSSECGGGKKSCGGECVAADDPEVGCASSGCIPCPALAHAFAICSDGACQLGGCEPGFFDCDGSSETGCEHSASTFKETMCGGCDADCTSLGLSSCQEARCGCANDAECLGDARERDVACVEQACVCGGTSCNPGEICSRLANGAECVCGGGPACNEGWVCCPSGTQASCKQLDGSDSANCGACGVRCAEEEACVAGVCQPVEL